MNTTVIIRCEWDKPGGEDLAKFRLKFNAFKRHIEALVAKGALPVSVKWTVGTVSGPPAAVEALVRLPHELPVDRRGAATRASRPLPPPIHSAFDFGKSDYCHSTREDMHRICRYTNCNCDCHKDVAGRLLKGPALFHMPGERLL